MKKVLKGLQIVLVIMLVSLTLFSPNTRVHAKTLRQLKEELADFPDLIRASTYVNYKDGVATGFKEGSLKDDEGNNILRVLTEAEIEELKNIYRSYFCK